MKQIKRRATLFSMGLVTLLIAIFIITISDDKKNVLDEKTAAHRALLKSSFELAMLDTQKGLSSFACKLAANRAIVDAFETGNRDELYRLSIPYFLEAKERNEVDLTGFIRADGTHFLRMQDPHKFGDNITKKRPMLAHAIAMRKPITSLDVTLYDVALVTIIPIFKDNTFIGIIQTSASLNRVQERLNLHSGIKSAIAFDTQKLRALLPKAIKKSYHGYSLISSNDPLFENLPSSFSFSHSKRYKINHRHYIIASRPLINFNNETVAMMTCAFDITDDVLDYEEQIRNLLIVSVILLAFIGIILHYGFQILIRRINRDAVIARELNLKLEHQLHSDYLTDLPNRSALIRDMEHNRFYALILLNIDNFKEINDFYGHAMGDQILLALGHSIQEVTCHFPMNLYKMPSDEYAIALTEPMSSSELDATRLSIIHHLQAKHYDLDGANIYITLTVGMAILYDPSSTSTNLLVNADIALKAAKKRHLSYMLYDEIMQIKKEYENNILWSKKVKKAIEENLFALHFQPIVDYTGAVIEYETLIRMIGEEGEIVSPALFLPAARQSRLYSHISRFVIDSIFNILESTPHTYSINLSVDDILDSSTRQFLMHKLSQSPHSSRLIFELLESEGIENYSEVSAFIAQVKQYGCTIAIDDFGTGYSNFAHIMKLDVDILKIDGSLIRNLDTDTNAQSLVGAISDFSKRLGLKTVAEFVHSEGVYTKCKELDIDYVQGYYISEPKPLF
ncbi:MAG: EAL domain-containing protein [Sulfuricurvum sp.]|uniref:EAL domain-containing protein n=1 Tax=Sulfuricurvum sp. TaxID=2025608 RepID=UPI0025EEF9EA|nr:EAL domain-containing protein [Sulfuricurvum sp.]MCK9372507.1 EAL domain-containing protein [Sulfuricurvum sp.]